MVVNTSPTDKIKPRSQARTMTATTASTNQSSARNTPTSNDNTSTATSDNNNNEIPQTTHTHNSSIPKKGRSTPRSLSPPNKTHSKESLRAHSCEVKKAFSRPESRAKSLERAETASKKSKAKSLHDEKDEKDSPMVLKAGNSTTSSCRKESNSGIPLLVKAGKNASKPSVKSRVGSVSYNNSKAGSTNSSIVSTGPKQVNSTPMTKHTLELQFHQKKRRLELLKKEALEKQKPLVELYQALVQLKKRLEDGGKVVPLDTIKVVDYGDSADDPDHQGGDGAKKKKTELDPEILASIQRTLQEIPHSLSAVCKNLISKRAAVIDILEKTSTHSEARTAILGSLKLEGQQLEQLVEDAFKQQEKKIVDLTTDWEKILESVDSPLLTDKYMMDVHKKVRTQEAALAESANMVKQLEEQINDNRTAHATDKMKTETEITGLMAKIKNLEKELDTEKRTNNDHKSKARTSEQLIKELKQKIKETTQKNKDFETKQAELQKKLKGAQDQIHARELQWHKEKEDLQRNIKNQEVLLQKMTTDRNHYETRLKASDEVYNEREKKHMEIIATLRSELDEARKLAIDAKTDRDTYKKKYESVEDQVVKMGIRNRQTLDVMANKNEHKHMSKEALSTERETELYTELLATKVTLRDYEDKIKNYEREKLRFIDTIEQLNGSSDENQSLIGSTLVKKEEQITQCQQLIKELEQKNNNRLVENENLKAEVRNLTARLEALEEESVKDVSSDLKKMVYEGRAKLNDAMKRSLENEQRIIQYEHDLDKQSKQINEMENLLKVRDGLIGMMKVKKDELQLENDSLNKYANEVRELLLETKEDLRCRDEMVHELSANLENKQKLCHRLEKKIKELEGTLSVTNEKRFKLQDTLGSVEKELQSTKAHISQMADLHTRPRVKFLK